MIQAEGVESLSEAELRQACRERGLLGLLSVEEMRQQVRSHSLVMLLVLILSCWFCYTSLFLRDFWVKDVKYTN